MTEIFGAMPPRRLGFFRCDQHLNVGEIHGDIAARLGCDSNELHEQGWRPFVSQDDLPIVGQMSADLARGRAGSYGVCALPTDGGKLYLAIRTLLLHDAGSITMAGTIRLEAWESPRTILLLKGAVKSWFMPYVAVSLLAC